jgi:hypothetical protein
MKKRYIQYFTSLSLLVTFFIVGLIGIFIFPGLLEFLGFDTNNFSFTRLYGYHYWLGLILLVITSIHIDLNWKWFTTMSKKTFKRKSKPLVFDKKTINYLVDIAFFISITLLFITGILKFPGFLPFLGIAPIIAPLGEISFIHDWSGLISISMGIIHVALNLNWIKSTTKSIKKLIKTDKEIARKIPIAIIVVIVILSTTGIIVAYTPAGEVLGFTSDTKIRIDGIGDFKFIPDEIVTAKEDIFKSDHFSIFDILVYLDNKNSIDMKYHFDESMNTFVIDSIDGKQNWWYEAYYDGGWSENNVFRMDHYPHKEKMTISLYQTSKSEIDNYHRIFKEEITRKNQNNGKIVIPKVIIRGTRETLTFNSVEVNSHNLRNDVFQDDVITAIDVILTLDDRNLISAELQWYESIGSAEIVKSYWVEQINNDKAFARCGFVYEEGSYDYEGFRGNHIHIPSDSRVLNSPQYIEYFWICI